MHAGSNDGTNIALNRLQAPHITLPCAPQACPVLSRAAPAVFGQTRLSLPINLETRLLSSPLATEALYAAQPAFNRQVSHRCLSWRFNIHAVLSNAAQVLEPLRLNLEQILERRRACL